ncbi:TolC family outer membrane protein [Grimontia sp. S25]|uniref:TolC family outer membrane protein n=1 Tax=Grimontia sedimenti TaxID=2711294 RepID=A0A6M1RDP3_9GAMM|nr:TolC family outer membrane protein [Grimontia sedimenti]NGN98400.1 TolC family outer membrane protein [Grimontia sedimenti]
MNYRRTKLFTSLMMGALASGSVLAETVDLKQLHQLALSNDPLLSQVNAQANMANESIDLAFANLLPQIHAYFNAGHLHDHRGVDATIGGSGNSVGVGAKLTQAIYTPAAKLSVDIAKQDASKVALLVEKAESSLVLRTSTAYFDVLRASDALSVAEANLNTIEEMNKQTTMRVELGLASDLDHWEAQAKYDMANANIIQTRAMYENSLDALYTLTGKQFSGVYPIDNALFSPKQPANDNLLLWQQKAQAQNHDLRMATQAMDIAKQQIALAQSGHKPTVVLFGGVNQELLMDITHLGGNKIEDGKLDNLTEVEVGIAANLPLYTGGRTSAQVDIAKEGLVLAQSVQEQTFRSVTEQINQAERFATASLHALKAHQQSLISAEAALKAIEKGHEVGTRTMTEVLDANTRYFQAQNQVNQAKYNFIINSLMLKFVAGELAVDDIHGLNASLKREL